MFRSIHLAVLALAFALPTMAQEPAPASQTPATPAQKQSNAASATQDTSGTTGDQITKPPAAKESTLIGCLAGPDKDGKYALHSMSYRTGVQVVGPDDLKNDSGSKVKLTGQWQPSAQPQPQESKLPEARRFQATTVEVMAPTCKAPGETTPVSKNKRQKPTTYNAPSSDQPK